MQNFMGSQRRWMRDGGDTLPGRGVGENQGLHCTDCIPVQKAGDEGMDEGFLVTEDHPSV